MTCCLNLISFNFWIARSFSISRFSFFTLSSKMFSKSPVILAALYLFFVFSMSSFICSTIIYAVYFSFFSFWSSSLFSPIKWPKAWLEEPSFDKFFASLSSVFKTCSLTNALSFLIKASFFWSFAWSSSILIFSM